jgi:hypothetical protein
MVASTLERLTASDMFLLLWDDFGWSGDIGGLAILDGTGLLDGEGRVRIEDVRRHLESRLHLVPRFRQRLYRPRRGLGWPLWVDAASFDLADHVRVHPLAAPGDQAQLLQACEQLARRRLDPRRPLWELWLLPGLPDRRVGAFLKLHHAIADGIAGVAAFGALLDLTADAPTPVAPAWMPTPIPTSAELLRDNLRRRGQGLGQALRGIAHPSRTLRRARDAWASGNQDGWMIVPLPLSESDPVRRLQLIAAETAERKHKPRPRTGSRVPLLFQRAFLRGFRRQRLLNTSVTNLPGPPVPLYLAGARLLELVPVVSSWATSRSSSRCSHTLGSSTSLRWPTGTPARTWRYLPKACRAPLTSWPGRCLGASFVNGGEIPLEASSDARSEHS